MWIGIRVRSRQVFSRKGFTGLARISQFLTSLPRLTAVKFLKALKCRNPNLIAGCNKLWTHCKGTLLLIRNTLQ